MPCPVNLSATIEHRVSFFAKCCCGLFGVSGLFEHGQGHILGAKLCLLIGTLL